MTTNKGTVANFNAHGQVSSIHATNGTMITRNSAGSRTVVSEHVGANGARYQVVSTGAHAGYVQRTTVVGGHQFVTRTYVGPGRTYVAVYRTRFYGGMPYYAYVPGYYWGPGFYGWAYDPWYGPAYYSWGWYGDPWYASYGYYYSPYPVYPSAAFWLTDYLVSETLRSAYEARVANEAAAADNAAIAADASYAAQSQPVAQNNNVVLTPEIKQMIADEVKAELAAERADAANTANVAAPEAVTVDTAANASVPPAMDPNMRLFIVAAPMEATADGQACTLSPGDVVIRTENVADNMNTVAVNVVSSQKNDCRMGSLPRLQVTDLQEMHNRFLEKMDSGLKSLADNQGKNGLPGAPTVEGRANPYGTVEEEATAKAEIENQNAEADQEEKEVQQAAPAPKAPSGN